MQLGPASVTAIRRGKVKMLYDVPFVISEVNSDIFKFVKENGEKILVEVDKKGYIISTGYC